MSYLYLHRTLTRLSPLPTNVSAVQVHIAERSLAWDYNLQYPPMPTENDDYGVPATQPSSLITGTDAKAAVLAWSQTLEKVLYFEAHSSAKPPNTPGTYSVLGHTEWFVFRPSTPTSYDMVFFQTPLDLIIAESKKGGYTMLLGSQLIKKKYERGEWPYRLRISHAPTIAQLLHQFWDLGESARPYSLAPVDETYYSFPTTHTEFLDRRLYSTFLISSPAVLQQELERDSAALRIQKGCHSWLYAPVCKDGEHSIMVREGLRELKALANMVQFFVDEAEAPRVKEVRA
ncbi:hypothetical protein SAICODRAFT_25783 [Saitoella complicata NRRL Y-17804]|uniref:Uncharacterized protein n=1 Tax=Saitoella complicata (strain BCRC 22490 / CBS 7301 / JCM 7358 / NBRC 10748 / NRRL Y-17804) TaxID=698492 RepID=A0A0E9NLE6_SAICN|nr:uncharacterized protein SAICODRAFT_25783 [Saitoella complicata NRRL Y-17804]ODQ52467.1 hypothetical protein SAICODRAFT_25783 [Saitoella complicata NRRL Y-17804]GAO50496.1 hypothetical protein G7K_4620-t1 [Saitoella complicata NRRL Y-17804]